jgi:2'-5' RNA ligase
MIRLFVGLALSNDLRDRLTDLQTGLPGARWVDSANLHVTLRFIGEVDRGQAQDLADSLSLIRSPAFDLSICGVGYFGQADKARLLYAGVERTPPLQHLRDKIESVCVRSGLEPDARKFKPHVTLAYLRETVAERVGLFTAEWQNMRCPQEPVEQFSLFSSWPAGDGRHYEEEATFPLSLAGAALEGAAASR